MQRLSRPSHDLILRDATGGLCTLHGIVPTALVFDEGQAEWSSAILVTRKLGYDNISTK